MKLNWPKMDLEVVGSFTGGDAAPGKTLRIDWEAIRSDVGGFPKMLMFLILNIELTYSTVAATMPAAMQAERLADVIQSFTMKLGDQVVIDNLRGLFLFHDSRRCNGLDIAVTPLPSQDIADADTTNATVNFDLVIPMTPGQLASGAELDGALPIAVLRKDDIQIKLSGAVGSTGDFGGFPGVTWSASTVQVIAVWAATRKLTLPTHWQVRTLDDSRKDFTVQPPAGYLYYLDIFVPDRTADYAFNHTDFKNIQVTIGSGQLEQWSDPSIPATLQNLRAKLQDSGSQERLSLSAPEYVPLIQDPRGSLASEQPTGPVKVHIGARGSHETTSLIYRTRGTRDDAWRTILYQRLEVPNGGALGVAVQTADGMSPPDSLRPHLAEEVFWPGMPFEGVVRARSAKFPHVR